jgi:hypothetical protein
MSKDSVIRLVFFGVHLVVSPSISLIFHRFQPAMSPNERFFFYGCWTSNETVFTDQIAYNLADPGFPLTMSGILRPQPAYHDGIYALPPMFCWRFLCTIVLWLTQHFPLCALISSRQYIVMHCASPVPCELLKPSYCTLPYFGASVNGTYCTPYNFLRSTLPSLSFSTTNIYCARPSATGTNSLPGAFNCTVNSS